MAKQIQRNPLGIRKVDYQGERRTFRREEAPQLARRILSGHLLAQDDQMIRCVVEALMTGWEQGAAIGAKKTRDRVAEALDKGTLFKQ
jgi:hypothetical protein